MPPRVLSGRFRDLNGFKERHTHRELEACAAALFLLHHDIEHAESCLSDLQSADRTAK
jgi:hypothetical protein